MEHEALQNLIAGLEALLFVYGEPVDFKFASKILSVSEAEIREAADFLASELNLANRGLFLIRNENKIQLSTKPKFGKLLESIMREEFKESLTPASLETLSIVLYAGPISRAEIDFIRGVNSTFILRSLLIRGLVDRSPDPKRSNVYLYKPSFELFKHLGISKAEDLPDYQKFVELIKNLRTPEAQELPDVSNPVADQVAEPPVSGESAVEPAE